MEKIKSRDSNVELLRIIAILLIVLSHSVPFFSNQNFISFVNLDLSSSDVNTIIMIIIRSLGQVGNVIFIICSAYFLVDSKRVKISKIIKIFFDATIISIACLLIFGVKLGFERTPENIVSSFFPTIYRYNYWFICCYILLYALHPVLNVVVENLSKRKLLLLNVCLITLYSIINMVYEKTFFYNELIGFIEVYFIVAYMKKYMLNFQKSISKNRIIFIVSLFLHILFIISLNDLGLKEPYLNDKMLYWVIISNPFVILISLALFNLFKNLKINSSSINFFASLTLLIYMISDNYFIRENLKPRFFDYYYGKNVLSLVGVEFLRTVCITGIIAILYKLTIKRVTDILSEWLSSQIEKVGSKILNRLEKIS